ncbi:PmoA family protein [Hymenobacter sp.]|jgi:hypothetical protein|uniref:DUF6807 domain-containing protein n=1 Tax=Hymenobacter sp. TaxID=1898978 RepID=UPI002ED9EC83
MQLSSLSGAGALLLALACISSAEAQKTEQVRVVKDPKAKKVDVFVGKQLFTTLLYPDTLEKPVLYPLRAANGTVVTRGFPVAPKPGDPTDHPHHLGLWFNFENVNGLDFWNNSYAIPAEKKSAYGWIKTDRITTTTSGPVGVLAYHANWTNQKNEVLLEETTKYEFSGTDRERTIDRVTTLKANTEVTFTDAKDGLLGLRVAHELQIPSDKDEKFTDDKGNVTVVKAGTDRAANGTYLTSTGKRGNDAWSTRAAWCKVYGKMGPDSISIAILDHPKNPNYPTYWHARGYGLFAANPLGEKVFTNGATAKNLQLKKGESVTFRYRVLIDEGSKTLSTKQLNDAAADFAKKNVAVK